MNWVSSFFASVLAGVAGLFLAGFIANACVSWYHVSSREGAAGYFVVFTAVAGGVAGFFIGLITSRLVVGNYGASFSKELTGALGVVLAIGGIAAWLCRFFADVPPEIDGTQLNLEVEFRFPTTTDPAKAPTTEGEWKFSLGSVAGDMQRTSQNGEIKGDKVRLEQGRWVVPAEVFLFTERGRRSISLLKNGTAVGGFLLPLPSRPGQKFEQWSAWMPLCSANGGPWPAEKMSYRFRVQKRVPPPPGPSHEDLQAEETAQEEAEFSAIGGDEHIDRWLAYLEKPAFKERAQASILQRPRLIEELALLVRADDPDTAASALHIIAVHPKPTADLVTLVETAGQDIVERIRKVNGTTAEADPSYRGAADVSIRFHGWMEAVRALRTSSGGDFTPQLKAILELSRVRTDSIVMRGDVCRIASFYLHEWAGIEPLPTDPKPR